MKKEIYILTGPINSGKTTNLEKWLIGRNDVFGILTPKENNKRFFKNIATGEQFQMDAEPSDLNTISIGKHQFRSSAFDRAIQIIKTSTKKEEGWLIIDEIGPLEISSQGFDNILRELLNNEASMLKLILVIRESLRDTVIAYYELEKHLVKNMDLTTNNS